jgi:ABC-type transport system involved in cytochrome c biogenesis ATPase subunit
MRSRDVMRPSVAPRVTGVTTCSTHCHPAGDVVPCGVIESLRFLSGYPTKLPGIQSRTLRFGERINIVFGPNGAGKTTILGAIAAATGCGGGGWSDTAFALDAGADLAGTEERQPIGLDHETGLYRARLTWDERPVYYQDCYATSETSFLDEGYLESREFLRSSGEKRIGLINELITSVENRFLTYKLPRHVRPALVLDEVDNHVGFVGQSVFWGEIVPRLSKKYQLIISTHSVFPLLLRRDTPQRVDVLFELSESYARQCLDTLGEAIDYYNESGDGSKLKTAMPPGSDAF